MLGDTRRLRLDVARDQERASRSSRASSASRSTRTRRRPTSSLGHQQQVEIIKALWRGSRVLILDEPTSMLTPQGVAELAKVLGAAQGAGPGGHLHHPQAPRGAHPRRRDLDPAAGRLAGTVDRADSALERRTTSCGPRSCGSCSATRRATLADVAELQEGLELVEGEAPAAAVGDAETVLELTRVSAQGEGAELGIEDVSLELRQGEIFGIAGVDGNGQRALAEVIAGQRHASHGEVDLYGAPVTRMSVSARQKLGLRYVTDDRLGEGIVGTLSVGLNLFLKRIGERPFWRHGRIQRAVVDNRATDLVRDFDVRTPLISTRAAALSGGNIQKVLLARELSFEPKVVVFHKPTYGLDVKTTATVRDLIRQLAKSGGAALVISTDLDELLEICDRIAVISRGRLVGVVPNGPGAAEHVGRLMVGSADSEAA